MPEIKHLFTAGKMNKDLDERVIPNDEYRDALNVQVHTSDGSDAGALQNISGNEQISSLVGINISTVGSLRDTENNSIYWFVISDGKSIIAEYNEDTDLISPVLVDTNNILNFSTDYLITGANIIDGLLFFTDNQTEPKKVNIAKFKEGSTNFTSHTQVYGRNFIESDITVIKPKPNNAPKLTLSDTVGGDAVESSAVFNFSKTVDGVVGPVEIGDSYTINILNTDRDWNIGDVLVFTEEENNPTEESTDGLLIIKGIITAYSGSTVTIEIITTSDDYDVDNSQYSIVKEQPDPLFELKFPRFGYRWKYEDGEYSVFSPFSEVAFIPGELEFNAKNGYNEGMANTVRKVDLHSFDTPPDNVEEVEILYKESNNNNVYTVEAVKKDELSTYNISSELIYKIVENKQLLRAWDNVPKKAKAQEISANRLMYGNYVQGYTVDKEPTIIPKILSRDGNGASIKSDRTYQVGVVFEDGYGRQSPVLANQSGVIKIDRTASDKINLLSISGSGTVPSWASKFKYYIKEPSAPYYNVVVDKYYLNKDEPSSVWISVPSAERNKVDENTYLILKKEHGSEIAVEDKTAKYKILDIDNEAPNFLTDKFTSKGQLKVTAVATAPATNASNIEVTIAQNDAAVETLSSGQSIRLVKEGNKSELYTISDVTFSGSNNTTVSLVVNEVFTDNDVDLFSSVTSMNIVFGEILTKVSPEFKNRFFIKLKIDPVLKQHLLARRGEDVSDYKIVGKKTIKGNIYTNINPDCSGTRTDANTGYYWESRSNGSNIIKIRRTGKFNGLKWSYDVNSRFDDFSSKLDVVGGYLKFSDDSDNEIYEIVSSKRTMGNNGLGKTLFNKYHPKKVSCNRWVQWEIELNKNINFTPNNTSTTGEVFIMDERVDENENLLTLDSPAIFETEPEEVVELDLYYETEDSYNIADWTSPKQLRWSNCFAFGNGVESDRIRDDFNGTLMGKGVRVSSVIAEQIKEEHKKNTIIFSGIYNSISGINQTNQFNQAEAITKDLNPEYGSIQKLHARNNDLIALCEDKVLQILANKDALYNADGNASLISSSNVLGQAVPKAGNFGISKNPESFAEYGNRFYFTDKARNSVLRWGGDGLTVISNYGMADYFSDALSSSKTAFIGSFDEDLGTYNIKIGGDTVGFDEMVKGWVSRYSFLPESGISLNAKYYTFKNGNMWRHNVESRGKNNFYGVTFPTKVTFVFNEDASAVKKFKTLAYEGDSGWVANYINTNLQKGDVAEFIDKEGKWFNYINGEKIYLDVPGFTDNWESKNFSSQGIGNLETITDEAGVTEGYMDAYLVYTTVEWRGNTYECVQE